MKTCNKCGENKPLDEFGKNKRHKDGLQYKCRTCTSAESRAWRVANPDKARENQRRFHRGSKGKEYRKINNRKYQRIRQLAKAEKSSKHTYLVTDGEFIKIGVFTEGKLDIRILCLQSGNPRKLKVLVTSASNIEKLCHYEFEHLNVLNEWFKIDLELITFFTEHAV